MGITSNLFRYDSSELGSNRVRVSGSGSFVERLSKALMLAILQLIHPNSCDSSSDAPPPAFKLCFRPGPQVLCETEVWILLTRHFSAQKLDCEKYMSFSVFLEDNESELIDGTNYVPQPAVSVRTFHQCVARSSLGLTLQV